MKIIFKNTLLLAIMLLMGSCTAVDSNQHNRSNDNEIQEGKVKSTVIIKGYYDKPSSIEDKDTIVLEGLSEGEFIEIIVKGKIEKFQHIRLEWNDYKNDLVEKETINKLDQIKNQTIVIKTYMPEGMPSEKIKWSSLSGKEYEFIVVENSLGDKNENVWEFELE